ncbi:hypothetical protein FACS1894162_3690 [Bacteroidia bacterium]|nr:hypothetical protein FACS1894162_3690 [Bacteroidia bacterium]
MNLYGKITIDGLDAFQEFGLLRVKNGSLNDWLTFPERKQPLTHDWKDEDGIEVDLDNVFLKEKNVSLPMILVANSSEQFWTNYNNLLTLLTTAGTRDIYFWELQQRFDVYYTKCDNVSKPTKLRGTNKIVVNMTLHFVIPTGQFSGIDYMKIGTDFIVS